jgi:hypothetical protein
VTFHVVSGVLTRTHVERSQFVKALLGAAVAAAALVVAAGAAAVNPIEGVRLKAVAKSGVTGQANATARGAGTYVVFTVRGLGPNAKVRAVMNAGNCKQPGASAASVGSAKADARGLAKWSASVLYRNAPVAWVSIADGAHLFQIVAGGRVVACGVIPGMS